MWEFMSYSSTAVFLIVQLVFLSQSNVSANEFYVVADNGFNCPVNRSCETIDYYINNQTRYFVSDTIFYFLEGTHFIQPEQTLLITLVNNITFLGLGRQALGFHETLHNQQLFYSVSLPLQILYLCCLLLLLFPH